MFFSSYPVNHVLSDLSCKPEEGFVKTGEREMEGRDVSVHVGCGSLICDTITLFGGWLLLSWLFSRYKPYMLWMYCNTFLAKRDPALMYVNLTCATHKIARLQKKTFLTKGFQDPIYTKSLYASWVDRMAA